METKGGVAEGYIRSYILSLTLVDFISWSGITKNYVSGKITVYGQAGRSNTRMYDFKP